MNVMKKHRSLFMMFVVLAAVIVFVWSIKRNISSGSGSIKEYVLVVHGGAGDLTRDNIPDSLEIMYREALRASLIIGFRILDTGGSALDAVEAVIRYLEDEPLFNAGRGSVFTFEGTNELDASIMDGSTGMAGAVAGVTMVKNPITVARAVMEKTPHVMLAGNGANAFAIEHGLDTVDPSWFFTQMRYQRWLQAMADQEERSGTVGAVALDKNGNLAAGTSTGGMSMKRFGRIGDSPVIGAGTYASNQTCAVSCTGHGEYFIRNAVAYDLSARLEYSNDNLYVAAKDIIDRKLKEQGGTGGLIAIDKYGNFVMEFNTNGMFRGYLLPDGETKVMIFDDEK